VQAGTRYEDGYEEGSGAVAMMWDILLNDFTDDERRLFLRFISGW
jgi:hypothetical protein